MQSNSHFTNHKLSILSDCVNQTQFPLSEQTKNHLLIATLRLIENNYTVSNNIAIPIITNISKSIDAKLHTKILSSSFKETIARVEKLEPVDHQWLFQICLTWWSKTQQIDYEISGEALKSFIRLYGLYKTHAPADTIQILIPEACAWLTNHNYHQDSLNLLRSAPSQTPYSA